MGRIGRASRNMYCTWYKVQGPKGLSHDFGSLERTETEAQERKCSGGGDSGEMGLFVGWYCTSNGSVSMNEATNPLELVDLCRRLSMELWIRWYTTETLITERFTSMEPSEVANGSW